MWCHKHGTHHHMDGYWNVFCDLFFFFIFLFVVVWVCSCSLLCFITFNVCLKGKVKHFEKYASLLSWQGLEEKIDTVHHSSSHVTLGCSFIFKLLINYLTVIMMVRNARYLTRRQTSSRWFYLIDLSSRNWTPTLDTGLIDSSGWLLFNIKQFFFIPSLKNDSTQHQMKQRYLSVILTERALVHDGDDIDGTWAGVGLKWVHVSLKGPSPVHCVFDGI